VELDNELGGEAVQVRVMQGKEPAHFLTIFKGKTTILRGSKASSFDGNYTLIIRIITSRIITISLMIIHCDLISIRLWKRAGSYIFDRLGKAPLK
jgi:hypothetical protein